MNTVKQNQNSEISFPTLQRYIEIYPKLLSNFLREYIDNNEKMFIEFQIEHYKTYGNEYLNKDGHTFNKYSVENLRVSRSRIVDYLEEKFNLILKNKISDIQNNQPIEHSQYWFLIGVKFATGEIQGLLKKHNNNATAVAKALGNNMGYRPYISSTIGSEKVKTDKNIYTRKKTDIELILNYCNENKLTICQDFKDKISHILMD